MHDTGGHRGPAAARGAVLVAPGRVAPGPGARGAGRAGAEEAPPPACAGGSPRPEDCRARAAAGEDDGPGGASRGPGRRPKKLGGAARPAGGDRAVMIALVEERRAQVGIGPLCTALGLARATFYRCRGGPPPAPATPRERRAPRQALTAADREGVLRLVARGAVRRSAAGAGLARRCSTSVRCPRVRSARCTACSRPMPRCRERRDQLRHPAYHKPELLATGPNQVCDAGTSPSSWARSSGPATSSTCCSTSSAATSSAGCWHASESARLGLALIWRELRSGSTSPPINSSSHADRGAVDDLSAAWPCCWPDLGVVPSHSRPTVSDDNPFSEAQFKTHQSIVPDFPRPVRLPTRTTETSLPAVLPLVQR